jgi:DNA-binding CsgD family transcriptional regulator
MQETRTGSALELEPESALPILTGRELLVLQLLGRRYSREQIAAITGEPAAVREAERSACKALGAAVVEEAVELARRRRLIL